MRALLTRRTGQLVFGLVALVALCNVASPALAGGPAFTDANWVSLPGVYVGLPANAVVLDAKGNLYSVGDFSNAGGLYVPYVAKWNGTAWSALGSGLTLGHDPGPGVHALASDSAGNVYVGGSFMTSSGVIAFDIAKWDGTNWSPLGSGVQPTLYPYTPVNALVCDHAGNLYVGGNFISAGGVGATNVAKWDGTNWSALGSGTSDSVLALALDGSGNLYVGGAFTSAGGVSANRIAKWNGSAWSALGSGMDNGTNPARVDALVCDGSNNLYACGYFTNAGAVSASNIAEWNGNVWSPLGSGMGGEVMALTVDSSRNLYAGAAPWGPNGPPVLTNPICIAKWNGTDWSTLGSGVGGSVFGFGPSVGSLVIDGSGNLYAGGNFTTAGTNGATNIAKALLSGPTPDELTLAQPGPSTNVITYLGTPGANYAVDAATNLTPPIKWIPQATNMASSNNATTAGYLTLTNASTAPQAFYRIRSVP
jgi:hypothetical protein